jgi:hypothetical protein
VIALTALGSQTVGAWLGLGSPGSGALYVKVMLDQSADPVIWRRLSREVQAREAESIGRRNIGLLT